MANPHLLPLLLTVTLAGCSKPVAHTPPEPEPEQIVATPVAAVVAATPAVAAAATPVPDPMAPDGVFYLLSPISVTTDDGIVGLKPGTQLQQTGEDQYTDAEKHAIQVPASLVTNNLRIAGLVMRNDAAAQAALRQSIAQARAAADAPHPQAASPSSPQAQTVAARGVTPAGRAAPGNKPVFGSGALGAVHSEQSASGYTDNAGHRHYKDVFGRWQVKK